MDNPWTTKTITEVYKNPWIRVTHRDVLNPSGNPGIYGVVHFQNLAIGVIPIDDDNHTWLVGQYRYTLDVYSWEIPMGGGPLGTDPLETAKRELKEETGLVATQWERIIDNVHLSNSVTDETGIAFMARGLTQEEAEPEDTEQLELKRVPLETAIEMALTGQITDILSVAALLRVKIWLMQP